jgi:hypothetical protein
MDTIKVGHMKFKRPLTNRETKIMEELSLDLTFDSE